MNTLSKYEIVLIIWNATIHCTWHLGRTGLPRPLKFLTSSSVEKRMLTSKSNAPLCWTIPIAFAGEVDEIEIPIQSPNKAPAARSSRDSFVDIPVNYVKLFFPVRTHSHNNNNGQSKMWKTRRAGRGAVGSQMYDRQKGKFYFVRNNQNSKITVSRP